MSQENKLALKILAAGLVGMAAVAALAIWLANTIP